MSLADRVESSFWSPEGTTGSWLLDRTLEGAALAFEVLVHARNRAFDEGVLRSAAPACPAVCVGNLTVGGSGKTPVVEHLARVLGARGERVAVLTRGFGRRSASGSARIEKPDPDVHGDEPAMLAARLPEVDVVVGANRTESAAQACAAGATVLLLDDGFQHRRLKRDLDLVVVDGSRGFGNGHLLPRGPLREPTSGLRRAQLVLVKRGVGSAWDSLIARGIEELADGVPVRFFDLVALELHAAGALSADLAELHEREVVAVSGIGNPAGFAATIAAVGGRVVEHMSFPDHHRYDPSDAARIAATGARHRGAWLVTTAKDFGKLEPLLGGLPLWSLAVEARFPDEFDLGAWVLGRLARSRAGSARSFAGSA